MERTLIPQGNERNRSYTITLPSEWIRNNHLAKKRTVNLDIINNRVIIAPSIIEDTETTIDATTLNAIIHKLIVEKYKLGIDIIKIKYDDKGTLCKIRSIVEKELMGFEIFDATATSCTIRDIAKESIEDFNTTLRRAFHLLSTLSKEAYDALEKNDKILAQQVIERDAELNKLIFYCERQLNKKSQEHFGKIQFYYFLLERMENIGDNWKGLLIFHKNEKRKMTQETLFVLKEFISKLQEFERLYFTEQLNYRDVNSYYTGLRTLRLRVLALYKTNKDTYLYYIGGLVHLHLGMNRALYSIK